MEKNHYIKDKINYISFKLRTFFIKKSLIIIKNI